ncbi:hypothetical protein CTEN210_02868 [Chaetoceros tenuissimus]|uniref:Leucine-rich repeat domain-containing protein n=1 Tax=Chaetoceros tenuissimus TaxID=426638 RepID=A0AAD3CKF4_9STRA|nr:hypothetical protein CTEN210_02868 [Chaetoceros tenuissimus]
MKTEIVDGLLTLFYDGSELYNSELAEHEERSIALHQYLNVTGEPYHPYCWDEDERPLVKKLEKYLDKRQSWEQVIVLDGVEKIPSDTFTGCFNIQRVIFPDSLVCIESHAFSGCNSLTHVKFPMNLEYIEEHAFDACDLASVFIPESCRWIGSNAFQRNDNLSIFHVPQTIRLHAEVIKGSKLMKYAPYFRQTEQTNNWIKNINNDDKHSLHRLCSSFQPTKEEIFAIIQEQGIGAFKAKNNVGVTPSEYLKENPYAELTEIEISRHYFLNKLSF